MLKLSLILVSETNEFDNSLKSQTEAYLLAGGKGSRLRVIGDLNLDRPKALVNVSLNGVVKPMIQVPLDGLIESGIVQYAFLTSHDPEAGGNEVEEHLTTFIEEKKKRGHKLRTRFSREVNPLGTAGAAANAMNCGNLDATGIVTPCDTLFPYHLLEYALEEHNIRNANLTWCVTSRPNMDAQNIGRLIVEDKTGIMRFGLEGTELQTNDFLYEGYSAMTSVGVIITNQRYFTTQFENYKKIFPEVRIIDIYRHLIPWLLGCGEIIHTYDIKMAAQDLGTIDRWIPYAPQITPSYVIDTNNNLPFQHSS